MHGSLYEIILTYTQCMVQSEGEILDVGQHSQGKAAMGIGCPLPVKRMECGDQCNTKPDISDVDSLIANSSAPLCSLVRLVGGKDQVVSASAVCAHSNSCTYFPIFLHEKFVFEFFEVQE